MLACSELESTTLESIASPLDEMASTLLPNAEVRGFLVAAEDSKATSKQVSPRIRMVTRESNEYLMFESIDSQNGEIWIHRSYIKK